MAKAVKCPSCGKTVPSSLFFKVMGSAKTKKKAASSRKNLIKAKRRGRWGAPKGNQNWRGRLKA